MKAMSRRQQGMEILDMMILFAIVAFCAAWVIKFAPYYVDDRAISSAIHELHVSLKDKDIQEYGVEEARTKLSKQFDINQLDASKLADLQMKYENNSVFLVLDYEVRQPFMGNIDVVFKFHHEVDLTADPDN